MGLGGSFLAVREQGRTQTARSGVPSGHRHRIKRDDARRILVDRQRGRLGEVTGGRLQGEHLRLKPCTIDDGDGDMKPVEVEVELPGPRPAPEKAVLKVTWAKQAVSHRERWNRLTSPPDS